MRTLLLLGLVLVVAAGGCDKFGPRAGRRSQTSQQAAQPAPGANPNTQGPGVHAPSGVVVSPGGGGGGSGGAAQAVRGAAVRIVTQTEMHNLWIFIEHRSGASGQMPTAQDTMGALQQAGDQKTLKFIQDGTITLTGTRSRENIWAYSVAQHGGMHFIVSASGVEKIDNTALNQRLQQQANR